MLDSLAVLSAANTENLANDGLSKEEFIPYPEEGICVCWFHGSVTSGLTFL